MLCRSVYLFATLLGAVMITLDASGQLEAQDITFVLCPNTAEIELLDIIENDGYDNDDLEDATFQFSGVYSLDEDDNIAIDLTDGEITFTYTWCFESGGNECPPGTSSTAEVTITPISLVGFVQGDQITITVPESQEVGQEINETLPFSFNGDIETVSYLFGPSNIESYPGFSNIYTSDAGSEGENYVITYNFEQVQYWNGPMLDGFSLQLNDSVCDLSWSVPITYIITAVNTPPAVNDDVFECDADNGIQEGQVISIPIADFLANDNDDADTQFDDCNLVDGVNGLNPDSFNIVGGSIPNNAPYDVVIDTDNGVVNVIFDESVDGCFNGVVTFQYEVFDYGCPPPGISGTANVTIEVCPQSTPPVVLDDAVEVSEGSSYIIPISELLSNDDDFCDINFEEGSFANNGINVNTLSLSIPAGFTGAVNGSNVIITPSDPCFNGEFNFDYTVSDFGHPDVQSGSATVVVTVLPVSSDPVINDLNLVDCQWPEGQTITISVLDIIANDNDDCDLNHEYGQSGPLENGIDPGSFAFTSFPSTHSITLLNGEVTLVPSDPCFNGQVSFDYTVSDYGFPTAGSGEATVTIDVCPVNSPPSINNDLLSGANYCEGSPIVIPFSAILLNDNDVCDTDYQYGNLGPYDNGINPETLTVDESSFTQPISGFNVNYGASTIEFTVVNNNFNGVLEFTYEVCDLGFPSDSPLCGSATVQVTIGAVNNPPTLTDYDNPTSVVNNSILVDSVYIEQSVSLNVGATYTIFDQEGNQVTVLVGSSTCDGEVSSSGTTITFEPTVLTGCYTCEIEFFLVDDAAGSAPCDLSPDNQSEPYTWVLQVYEDPDIDGWLSCACDDLGGITTSIIPGYLGCGDNCPEVANPDQANGDNDAFGDACDNCRPGNFLATFPLGGANPSESYIGGSNHPQNSTNSANGCSEDEDGDGIGDCCDQCPDVDIPGGILGCTDPQACNYNPFAACTAEGECHYNFTNQQVIAINNTAYEECITSEPNFSIDLNVWLENVFSENDLNYNFSPEQSFSWTYNGNSIVGGLLFPNSFYDNCNEGCALTVTVSGDLPPSYVATSGCTQCPAPSQACQQFSEVGTTLVFELELHRAVQAVQQQVTAYEICSGQEQLTTQVLWNDTPYLNYSWEVIVDPENLWNESPITSTDPTTISFNPDPGVGVQMTVLSTVNGSACGPVSQELVITVADISSIVLSNPSVVDDLLLFCPGIDGSINFGVQATGGSSWTVNGSDAISGPVVLPIADLNPGGSSLQVELVPDPGCLAAETTIELVAIPVPSLSVMNPEINLCSNNPSGSLQLNALNIDPTWYDVIANDLNGDFEFNEDLGLIEYENYIPGVESVTISAIDTIPGTEYGCPTVQVEIDLVTQEAPQFNGSLEPYYCEGEEVSIAGIIDNANNLFGLNTTSISVLDPEDEELSGALPASYTVEGVDQYEPINTFTIALDKEFCQPVVTTLTTAFAPRPEMGTIGQNSIYNALSGYFEVLCANSNGEYLYYDASALPGGTPPDVDFMWQTDPNGVFSLQQGNDTLNLIFSGTPFSSGSIDVTVTESWTFGDDHTCAVDTTYALELSNEAACIACELITLPGPLYLACADFGETFQWGYFDDGNPETPLLIESATNSWFEPQLGNEDHESDNMFVIVNPGGCSCISMMDIPTNVETVRGFDFGDLFELYPVPTNQQLTCELDERLTAFGFRIEIFNTLGQSVKTLNSRGSNRFDLDVSSLSSGLYIVQLNCLDYPLTSQKRIIIQH